MTIRWGIAATGNIARSVLADLPHVPDAEVVAVGSRSLDRARRFADEHGIARAHGSYRDLLDDDGVDVIYIATPHPQHHQLALAAIEAGKHLLIEKAFTATMAGAEEVVAAARAQGVFCMEAMWTRFQPAVRRLHELVDAGALGELRGAQGTFCIDVPFDPEHRLYNPQLGGGSVLDLGVYPIAFAHDFLGAPTAIHAAGTLAETGVDAYAAVQLTHGSGAVSSLASGTQTHAPNGFTLFGSEAWLEVVPPFHHSETLVLHRPGADPETIASPRLGKGYAHELIEVNTCIRDGRTESALMSLDDTLAVMRTLTAVTDALGVSYAEDPATL